MRLKLRLRLHTAISLTNYNHCLKPLNVRASMLMPMLRKAPVSSFTLGKVGC